LTGDDDMAWLEALAGRESLSREGDALSPDASVREAAALRELIRTHRPEPEIPHVPAMDPVRENELIARARAAGLVRGPAAIPMRRLWTHRGTLAAAAVVVLAIGITLLRTVPQNPETLRGGGTAQLRTADPAALKRELTEELTAAGAHVTGFERLGRPGIDADLPQPLTPEVRRILEKHHLPIPADGELTIEFEPTGQP
jgi:hypothetical protein